MRAYLRLLFLSLLSCALAVPVLAQDSDENLKSYKVKAAFVFNFLNFTTLPNPDLKEIVICTLANQTVSKAFASIAGKKIRGIPISVKESPSEDHLSGCSVTFLSEDWQGVTEDLLATAKKQSMLTIGEHPEFCKNGGIIGFYVNEGKLRFQINLNEANKQGYKFSSKLLKLATVIK